MSRGRRRWGRRARGGARARARSGAAGSSRLAGLVCPRGPEAGVDVGEDAVANFDGDEALFLLLREAAVGGVAEPCFFELVELVVVGVEAEFGVVAGGAGGDEEL